MISHSMNITHREVEHSIMAIIELFESNNNNLSKTEDTIFMIVYGILCCLSGKEGGEESQYNVY